MEALLMKHLKKVLAVTSPKPPAALEAKIQSAISDLGDAVQATVGASPRNKNADKHFPLLQAICESKEPRLVDLALSCIHVLIERGYLQGKTSAQGDSSSSERKDETAAAGGTTTTTQRTLIDLIIETVTKCSEINDDNVHVQAIKVLLTAITSSHCEVHDASLLLAIQACFHVHLVSRNQINKITAKAALTQMVSNTIARMEVLHEVLVDEDSSPDSSSSSPRIRSSSSSNSDTGRPVSPSPGGDVGTFPTATHKDSFLIFRALCKLSMKGAQADFDTVQQQANKGRGGALPGGGDQFDGNTLAVQNKMLSLEMILVVLNKSGKAFRSVDKFTEAIRKYLCMSLLGNCTSPIPQVTALSLQIFAALIDGFKEHLKTEFEVFFTSVFLKIVESENSSYGQKLHVIEVFHKICENSTSMLEFFINYDCDMDSTDVFRKIVDGYARIVKTPSGEDEGSNPQAGTEARTLREKGMEGMVMILQSLLQLKGITDVEAMSDTDTPSTSGGGLAPGAGGSNGSDNRDDRSNTGGLLPPDSPTNSEQSTRVVDAYDRKQRMQEQVEVGILKFNQSPKKGLLYLIDVGHLVKDPKSVARFFHLEDRLDKTQIGDILAREPEYMDGFTLEVLHEYVEMLDFADMSFDLALRHFLAGFRLPGEAQKIDRLMEKFAERYYLQNSTEFASADMAFILAFSTIMLQTNLHNPAIKDDKRMTREQFIKQNKGITSDGELSDELLSEIYERIAAEEISMTSGKDSKKAKKDADAAAAGGFSAFQGTAESRRMDAFNDERKEMMRASQTLFKKKHATRGSFFVKLTSALDASSAEKYTRPMFDVAWAPIIGVLSHVFETYGDTEPALLTTCLDGFKHSIRLACRLGLPVVRSTYVNALSKMTALDMVREMRNKNLEAVNALIAVAFTEGDFLGPSWKEVFTCISRLSRLEQFGETGVHMDEDFFSDSKHDGSSGSSSGSGSSHNEIAHKASKLKSVEDANASLVTDDVDMVELDRLFLNSSKLSQDSVVDFVRELVAVSREELLISSSSTVMVVSGKETLSFAATPRIFSLQKLVEVADFNMHSRSRLAWANIWSMLAEHFTQVGTDENLSVAMYAIDSLKQLSIKFLQKEELSNFNFQRVFLKPFEVIMARTKSMEISDLVLRCIDMMVLACASNIRSGWRTIFNIFEVCSNHRSTEESESAFGIIERLMESWLDFLFQNDGVALMNCLVSFVGGSHTGLSLRALTHLRRCADKIAEGSASKTASIDGDAGVFGSWWPLLFGLSTRVADHRIEVRIKALDTLDGILEVHGGIFSDQAWAVIFRGVLFPMIDSAKTDESISTSSRYPTENPMFESRGDSWIGTIGLKVMNIYLKHFRQLQRSSSSSSSSSPTLLPDFLAMLESCICHPTEALARMGVSTLGDLILSLDKSDRAAAGQVSAFVCGIITNNLCVDFGSSGALVCSQDIPSAVKASLLDCRNGPLNVKIGEAGGQSRGASAGDAVLTPYGAGEVVEIVDGTLGLGVGNLSPRHAIKLPWGTLYTPVDDPHTVPDTRRLSRVSPDHAWEVTARCAMTSMVVSLDIIHVVSVVFHHFSSHEGGGFASADVVGFLDALETSHWHARSFNEDSRLSLELQSKHFMRFEEGSSSPPNLLEQEIRTSSEILEIAQTLSTDNIYQEVITPWARRYTASVVERYLELDASLQSINPIEKKLIDAYKPAVMTVLDGLKDCTESQYRAFGGEWMMALVTKLILCHDFEVRVAVSAILPSLVKWSDQ
jgi:brefeldin A-inhibited guanine nucleotide-exchange protein